MVFYSFLCLPCARCSPCTCLPGGEFLWSEQCPSLALAPFSSPLSPPLPPGEPGGLLLGAAGSSHWYCLGLVSDEGEEMGRHMSWCHPLGAELPPCKVSSNFSAAEGCCQSRSWSSPALRCRLCWRLPRGREAQPATVFSSASPHEHLHTRHAPRVASLCASPPFNSLACIIQKP